MRSASTINSQRLHQLRDPLLQVIPRRRESSGALPISKRRIGDRPMLDSGRTRPEWAVPCSGIADCDDDVERLIEKLVGRFGLCILDVDPDLGERGNSQGMDPSRRSRPGGHYVDHVSMKGSRQPLGHLAPRRVAGAEKEDSFLWRHGGIVSACVQRRRVASGTMTLSDRGTTSIVSNSGRINGSPSRWAAPAVARRIVIRLPRKVATPRAR